MRLVVLLSVRVPAAGASAGAFAPDAVRIGVHLPVEHQARQALLAGADQILVRSDLPTPDVSRAIDRLARESGVPVLLAGDGPDLARRIERDDRVLMLGTQMIVPQAALEALADAPMPALLVTPTETATAHFERIDGTHVWAGGVIFSGEMLLDTVDMLGEWDLELTLLRRAVQQGARRIELPVESVTAGELVRVEGRIDADRVLAALSRGGFADEARQDALSMLMAPVARRLVGMLMRFEVNPDHLAWASGMLAIFGLAVASAGWPVIALVLALLAESALGLHRGCGEIMLRREAPLWLRVLVQGAGLGVLAVIGGRLAEGGGLALLGVALPLALIAVQTVADRRAPPLLLTGRARLWTRLTPAMAGVAALAGALVARPLEAFILIGLCTFGTVAARLLAGAQKRI